MIFGKYKKSDTSVNQSLRITGTNGKSRYDQSIGFDLASGKYNEGLKYLWARNKLINLSDYAYDHSGNEKRVDEIIQLGLKYNLLTEHTSFIAVDSVIRKGGEIQKIKQPLPLPEGVSELALAGMTMDEDVSSLEEVVVTGYGTLTRKLYCSIASVQVVEAGINNHSSRTNALQGSIAGVVVSSNNGTPGSGTSIRIRGASGLVSNNQPLYIIDSVALETGNQSGQISGVTGSERLAGINPEDISQISILKSAAATAIYGSRAANGVIIITTKSTKTNQLKVAYKNSFEVQHANKLPALQNSFAQGRSINRSLEWQGAAQSEVFSWGPAINILSYTNQPDEFNHNGQLTKGPGNKRAQRFDQYDALSHGYTIDQQIRFGKSNDQLKYDFSIGHTNETGIFQGTNFSRINLSSSIQYDPTENLSVEVSAGLHNNRRAGLISGGSRSGILYGITSTSPSFDNSKGFSNDAYDNPNSYELSNGFQRSYNNGLTANPYRSLNRNINDEESQRYQGNIQLKYDFTDNLKFHVIGGLGQITDSQIIGFAKNSAANPFGYFADQRENSHEYNTSVSLDYKKNISSFSIQTMTVYQYSGIKQKVDILEGRIFTEPFSFTSENVENILRTSNLFKRNAHNLSSKIISTYQGGLSLNLGMNNEWTSTLSKTQNHLFNSSAGISITPFDLLNNIHTGILNNFRLRGEINFSQKDAPYFLNPSFLSAMNNEIGNFNAFYAKTELIGHDNLAPENINGFEVGGEIGLFHNRVRLDFSYYQSKNTNMILPVAVPDGFSLINGGSMENKGMEITLNTQIIQRNGWNWTLNAHFSITRPFVTSLPEGVERIALTGFKSVSTSLIAGQPYGVIYGSRFLRNADGDKVIGEDGFPLVDLDLGIIGNPNPDWLMGIESELKFKNFSLSFLIDIKKGGDIWNGTKNTLNYLGTSRLTGIERSTTDFVFSGVKTDDSQNDAAVDFYNENEPFADNRWVRYGIAGIAEEAIEDGSWIRMRNVSLNYKLPEFSVSKLRFKNAKLTLYARNLFLITSYSGVDPESKFTGYGNEPGLDYFNNPSTRSFGISFTTEF